MLFRKADAFLAKSMDDRTTDRLRCKPTFWAAHGHIVTESALRFTAFAGEHHHPDDGKQPPLA